MGESIAEFMDRQRRKVARFGREAEAAAHEAYRKAIRAGENLRLSSPDEVMRHGAKLLQDYEGRAADAVLNPARNAKLQAGDALRRAGENPVVRYAAIDAARHAGNAAGVVKGGVHAVQGAVDGAAFVNRLLDPLDALKNPQGESAVRQLGRGAVNAGRMTADYVQKGIADPRSVVTDVTETAKQWRRELDPSATPAASTFEGDWVATSISARIRESLHSMLVHWGWADLPRRA